MDRLARVDQGARPPITQHERDAIRRALPGGAVQRGSAVLARHARIESELSDASAYADGGTRAGELGKRQVELRGQLEVAEAALLALYEADAA